LSRAFLLFSAALAKLRRLLREGFPERDISIPLEFSLGNKLLWWALSLYLLRKLDFVSSDYALVNQSHSAFFNNDKGNLVTINRAVLNPDYS